MKKKTVIEAVVTETPNPIEVALIGHIPINFGREDLNMMARKINELIDYVNYK